MIRAAKERKPTGSEKNDELGGFPQPDIKPVRPKLRGVGQRDAQPEYAQSEARQPEAALPEAIEAVTAPFGAEARFDGGRMGRNAFLRGVTTTAILMSILSKTRILFG